MGSHSEIMNEKSDVYRVDICRTECDEYSIDIDFAFITAQGPHYEVHAIHAPPDIFEVKAHTLSKILSGKISLPRTLDFGLGSIGGRYVNFCFHHNGDQVIILTCTAYERTFEQVKDGPLSFDITERACMELLLDGLRFLSTTPSSTYTWTIGNANEP